MMGLYGFNKRSNGRVRREIGLGLKSAKGERQVYSIDFSPGGMKVGAAMLHLTLGEPAECVMEKNGMIYSFQGHVARNDGIERINRIGRDANAFFIRINDDKFSEFVKVNFRV